MADIRVKSEIAGSVWKILKNPGEVVAAEDDLLLLESMKMEIPVLAEIAGTVTKIDVKVGDVIKQGDLIAVVS